MAAGGAPKSFLLVASGEGTVVGGASTGVLAGALTGFGDSTRSVTDDFELTDFEGEPNPAMYPTEIMAMALAATTK